MKLNRWMLTLTVVALTTLGVACQSEPKPDTSAAAPTAEAPEITVDALAEKLDSKAAITVCDANGEETRKEQGVIPGAILLTSHSEYDMSVLPADKGADVVFYCGSEKCSAAPKAAEKAMAAGYSNVRVLRAGIKGWVAAGKPVTKEG